MRYENLANFATTPQLEKAFQRQVVEAAEILHWAWLHVYHGQFKAGRYRTPTDGPLGKGWPDLLMVRDTRILAAELKVKKNKPTDDQHRVLALLQLAGVEVYVWRPDDWDQLTQVLA